jgi:hypothetical protein
VLSWDAVVKKDIYFFVTVRRLNHCGAFPKIKSLWCVCESLEISTYRKDGVLLIKHHGVLFISHGR